MKIDDNGEKGDTEPPSYETLWRVLLCWDSSFEANFFASLSSLSSHIILYYNQILLKNSYGSLYFIHFKFNTSFKK